MYVTKLQITFHNILKRNIGLSKYDSTSATCALTNTQCCQSTIRNLVFKFMCRLKKSDNEFVKALLASSVVYSSRIHSHTPLSYFRLWPFPNEAIRPYEYLRLANVVYCCVPCFTNSFEKTSSVSFHKFPKYKALLQKWIVNLRKIRNIILRYVFIRLLLQLQLVTGR